MYSVYIEFIDGTNKTIDFGNDILGAFRKQHDLMLDKKFLKNVRQMKVVG